MTQDTYKNMMLLLQQTKQRRGISDKDAWAMAYGIAGKDSFAKFTEADGQKLCSALLGYMERAS